MHYYTIVNNQKQIEVYACPVQNVPETLKLIEGFIWWQSDPAAWQCIHHTQASLANFTNSRNVAINPKNLLDQFALEQYLLEHGNKFTPEFIQTILIIKEDFKTLKEQFQTKLNQKYHYYFVQTANKKIIVITKHPPTTLVECFTKFFQWLGLGYPNPQAQFICISHEEAARLNLNKYTLQQMLNMLYCQDILHVPFCTQLQLLAQQDDNLLIDLIEQ